MDLDDLNTTELALVAQDVDGEAHRGQSREALLALIESGECADLKPRFVNKARLRIMQYVVDHWKQVEPLLSCPASSKEPRACFQCTDLQAIECAVTNLANIFPQRENAP